MSDPVEPAIEREALRVYRRYAVEIVEALGFCPYAERSRIEGHTREVVMPDRALDLGSALAAVRAIASDGSLEIGLLLFPRLYATRRELALFVESLRAAHQREPGGLVMAMEGFHPDAEPDTTTPERAVPFVRRTPDPTIQLVRHAVLDRVRRGTPQGTGFFDPSTMSLEALLSAPAARPIHERIAETNHATIVRLGSDAVRAILDDIQRDRDRSYAPLLPPRSAP